MLEALYDCKTVVVNSDLFVFGGYLENGEYDNCVRIFSSKTKTWSCKLQSDIDFEYCSICSFKQNIYVMRINGSCFVYNFETNKLCPIADMNERRYDSACTVFEGKIVVIGGYQKKVEAYDCYENIWTYLPHTIERRNEPCFS